MSRQTLPNVDRVDMPSGQFSRDDGVTLKEYLEARINDLQNRSDVSWRLHQAAIDKSEATMNTRLQHMNEWRAQLKDERSTFVTLTEYNLAQKFIMDSLRRLELSAAVLEGKASQSAVNRALAFSVISAILGLAGMVIGLTK